MSAALQFALFLASVAIVVFVAFCIPAVLQLRRYAARITQSLEELKAEVSVLVEDSRTVLRSVSELSTRAHQSVTPLSKSSTPYAAGQSARITLSRKSAPPLSHPFWRQRATSRFFTRGSRSFLKRF